MYFLTKLHKNPPGIRSIVSGCAGPTENISSFLDYIIKPLVPLTPSYIKDSSHVIALLEILRIPEKSFLVTIDVVSLYTNIPQHEGTQACLDAIEAANASDLGRDVLQALFDIVLVGNLFRFDSQVYSQLVGTAMGRKWHPVTLISSWTGLNEAFLIVNLLGLYGLDIFCVWTGSRPSLDAFLDRLNSIHSTLRLTWEISHAHVEFFSI